MQTKFLLLLASATLAVALPEMTRFSKRTEPPPSNGALVPSNCVWTNLGCYNEPSTGRILPGFRKGDDSLTVEKCFAYCLAASYSYALVEFGRECWCDNSATLTGGTWNGTGTGCRLACAGDSTELCGGQSKGILYHLNPSASTCTTGSTSSSSTSSSSTGTCVPDTTTITSPIITTTTTTAVSIATATLTITSTTTDTTTAVSVSTETATQTITDTTTDTTTAVSVSTETETQTITDTSTTTDISITTTITTITDTETVSTTIAEPTTITEPTTATATITIPQTVTQSITETITKTSTTTTAQETVTSGSITITVSKTVTTPKTESVTATITLSITIPTTVSTTVTALKTVTYTVSKTITALTTTAVTTTIRTTTCVSTTVSTNKPKCTIKNIPIGNSGFENNCDDSWGLFRGGRQIDADYASGGHSGSGCYRFQFDKGSLLDTYLTLKQEIIGCPGTHYVLTAWTKRPIYGTGCTADFYINDQLVASSNNDSSNGWAATQSKGSFQPGDSGKLTLSIKTTCPGSRKADFCEFFLDDVTITATDQ